jgi:hypothetical protein
MKISKTHIAGLVLGLCSLFHVGSVAAHGKAASMQDDVCSQVIAAGNSAHFSIYVPDVASTEQFCDNVPKGGEAVVVVDLISPELRQIPIEMRVVKDDPAAAENLDAATVAYVPAEAHPHGVIRTDATLEAGHYFIVVNAGGPEPFTYQYGVWVERPNYGRYITLALLTVIIGFGFYKLSKSEWIKKRLAGLIRPDGKRAG